LEAVIELLPVMTIDFNCDWVPEDVEKMKSPTEIPVMRIMIVVAAIKMIVERLNDF
jgi:hypothetical protein